MNKIHLFNNVSFKYYKSHPIYALCILIPVILCVTAIFCMTNLKISSKMREYQNGLEWNGNFDFLFYDLSEDDLIKLKEAEEIKKIGIINRIANINISQDSQQQFIVGYADETAQEMLPLKISYGHYPTKDNEILTTREFLMSNKINPEVGAKVNLYYRTEGKNGPLWNVHECIVSGIYEKYYVFNQKKQKRYVYDETYGDLPFDGYPEIYVTRNFSNVIPNDNFNEFHNAVLFDVNVTSSFDDKNLFDDVTAGTGKFAFLQKYNTSNAKIMVRSNLINNLVIGFSASDVQSANTSGYNNIVSRIGNDSGLQDFFTIIFIPFISSMLIIISVVSVLGMLRISILHRKPQFRFLHILGMSKYQLMFCILIEMILISVTGSLMGLLSGIGLYEMILSLMGNTIPSAFKSDEIIKELMPSPYPFIITLNIISIIFCMLTAWKILFLEKSVKINRKQRKMSSNPFFIILSLKNRNNKIYRTKQLLELITMSVLSVSVVLTYCYFTVIEQKNYIIKTEYPYGNYYAEKDYNITADTSYCLENHHDFGISADKLDILMEDKNVDGVYASIINLSSRLCYDEGNDINTKLKKSCNGFTQNSGPNKNDLPVVYEKSSIIFEKIGFSKNEILYSTPMIGLTDEYIELLSKYVIDGKINLEKIKSGEEIILLQPPLPEDDPLYEEYKKRNLKMTSYSNIRISEIFSVGDTLPLTDIVLDKAAEESNEFTISDEVFRNLSVNGKRTDIPVKIGAIVYIKDNDSLYNLINFNGICGRFPLFNIICSNETYTNISLPDKNITRLYIQTTENCDYDEFNPKWESLMAECNGINSYSLSDVTMSIREEKEINLSKFISLFLMLSATGSFGILVSVWYQFKVSYDKMLTLYNLGISKYYLFWYHSFKETLFAITSVGIAVAVSGLLQYIYNLFMNKADQILQSEANLNNYPALLFWHELLPSGKCWFSFPVMITPVLILVATYLLMIYILLCYQLKQIKTK